MLFFFFLLLLYVSSNRFNLHNNHKDMIMNMYSNYYQWFYKACFLTKKESFPLRHIIFAGPTRILHQVMKKLKSLKDAYSFQKIFQATLNLEQGFVFLYKSFFFNCVCPCLAKGIMQIKGKILYIIQLTKRRKKDTNTKEQENKLNYS